MDTSSSCLQHVQNQLRAQVLLPKKPVGKSKFANNVDQEISDENSVERGSLLIGRPQTEEDIHLLSQKRLSKSSIVATQAQKIDNQEEISTKNQNQQNQNQANNRLVAQKLIHSKQKINPLTSSESGFRDSKENCLCNEVLVADDDAFNVVTF